MSGNKFNTKIAALARSGPDTGRLQDMESRVWQAISNRRSAMPRNIFESWLSAVFAPEYRLASLSLGLVTGVFAALLSMPSPQAENASAALNLHVFSSHYGVTSAIFPEKKGERT